MLKATILENQRTLDLVLEKYRHSGGAMEIKSVCDGWIGENQAVMSCIGILADMGHDSLQAVTYYPRSAGNDLHA